MRAPTIKEAWILWNCHSGLREDLQELTSGNISYDVRGTMRVNLTVMQHILNKLEGDACGPDPTEASVRKLRRLAKCIHLLDRIIPKSSFRCSATSYGYHPMHKRHPQLLLRHIARINLREKLDRMLLEELLNPSPQKKGGDDGP